MSPAKRIIFTGGSGFVGRHVISSLLKAKPNYNILNLDIKPLDNPSVHTINTDLTHSGQVFNTFTSHFKITQPFREPISTPDAVIHFAGIPRNLLVPDDELFRNNTLGAYNVVEAACKLGVKKIILASSITVYGVTFAEGDVDFPCFPVDEEVDVNPMDTYAISKICMETLARGFARRFKDVDIYVLRLGAVIMPEEYEEAFKGYVEEPEEWKGHGWSYSDVRDLGRMCGLGIEVDGLGFQIFNAVNDEITNEEGTEGFLKRVCPDTPFRRRMGDREAPISNWKIREILGFKEEHSWRKYYKPG